MLFTIPDSLSGSWVLWLAGWLQLRLYHRNRTLNFSGEPLERKPRHCICSLQSPEPTHYKITSFSSSDPFLLFSFRHKSEIRGTESHLGVINRCVSFINPNFLAVFSSGSQIFSSINAYTFCSSICAKCSFLFSLFLKFFYFFFNVSKFFWVCYLIVNVMFETEDVLVLTMRC